MIRFIRPALAGVSLAMGLAASPAAAEEKAAETASLEEVIAGEHRSTENKARDKYRHPLETLRFFGLEPDMTVVEIYPGRGWYTEILAPYLEEQGTLYVAQSPEETPYGKAFEEKLEKSPELYGEVKQTTMSDDASVAPEGSADLVLTFRNVHSWMDNGTENEAFAAMYKALKAGGVLGLVQHRGDAGVPQDFLARSGYVNEEYVIELAEKAGFELVEKSEINANSKDVKDYPMGVWTLPPTYRLGDKDRDKYAAIGESDRMTLKFVKPAS